MLKHLRRGLAAMLRPVAVALTKAGVSADAITWLGTIATCASAVWFLARGEFLVGPVVVALAALLDALDGTLARFQQRTSVWGAFLDSTLDRVADAAIFGSVAWWFAFGDPQPWICAAALACLVAGSVVSYTKARGEAMGCTVDVGIAERADRLLIVLFALCANGVGAPVWFTGACLVGLAAISVVTVAQRMQYVARQLQRGEPTSLAGQCGDAAGQ